MVHHVDRSRRVLSARNVHLKPVKRANARVVAQTCPHGKKKEVRQLRAGDLKTNSGQAKKAPKRVLVSKDKALRKPPPERRSVHPLRRPRQPREPLKQAGERMSKLEEMSISAEVQNQYVLYYNRFVDYCKESGMSMPTTLTDTDVALSEYLDSLYYEGKSPHEGEKTMAAIEFHRLSMKGSLFHSKRALKGWRKAVPPQSRLPLPRIMMFGIAMELVAASFREMALLVVTAFLLYLRPGEGIDLKKRNVVSPVKKAGVQFKWTTVVIRDVEGMKPDKVGVYDNSLPIDQPKYKWLGDELVRLAKKQHAPDSHLFTFSMEEFRSQFAAAGTRLGVEALHPYQLRHGGATDDLTSKSRDFPAVKARGRWMTDQSVRRYTKVGRVQQLLNKLTPDKLSYCLWAEKNLHLVLSGVKAAKSSASR